jgi:hypothetical protein
MAVLLVLVKFDGPDSLEGVGKISVLSVAVPDETHSAPPRTRDKPSDQKFIFPFTRIIEDYF